MSLLIGLVAGYMLAQFLPMSKVRGWIDTFRKDGVGEADDDWTKPGGSD